MTITVGARSANDAKPARLGALTIMRAVVALVLANARYWTSVFPFVHKELFRWKLRAKAIPDPMLRRLAEQKLREERFNVEVAATLATLAGRAHRRQAVEAIVALQIVYDYLDALTEQSVDRATRRTLLVALTDAVATHLRAENTDPNQERRPGADYYRHYPGTQDGGYLEGLVEAVRRASAQLPAAHAITSVAERSAQRCAEAQLLGHAAMHSGDIELERWARSEAAGTALGWPELLAGAQASVLVLHALIAAAADPLTTHRDAEALDAVYLSIGSLTMLDSLIDHEQDLACGEQGYIRHYESHEQMALRLTAVTRDTAVRAQTLRHGAHHLMTLAGVIAYYCSAPGAKSAFAHPITTRLNRELRPLMTATLSVMRTWRLAKRVWRQLEVSAMVALALLVLQVQALQARAAQARSAHALTATDTAHLRYISASGSLLFEEGRASGTLPGNMRAHFDVGAVMSGSFVIHTVGGSIRGHGSAALHGSGVYESFAGSIVATGGSGRFAHAHGRARLYGTFNRNTYALVVQTLGTLRY